MTIVRCGRNVIPCPICSKKFRAKRWVAHIFYKHSGIYHDTSYVFSCPYSNICNGRFTSIQTLIKHCNKCHNLPRMGKLHYRVPITDVEDTILMLEESDNEDLMNTDYETDDDVVNFSSLSRIRGNPAPVAVSVAAPVADSTVDQHEPMDVGIDNNPTDVITDTSTVESNANDSLMKANWIETFILKLLYKTPFSDSTMESVIETVRKIISKVCDDIVNICQSNQYANGDVLKYISDLCELASMTDLVKKINGREEIKEKIVHADTAARGVDEAPSTHSASYISLKDSIEKYINMRHILPYVQFPHPPDQNAIDSCLNGLAYRTIYNKHKKFLAVNVYIDDISMNTAIGSYSNNNGITNVSYSIPNVVRQRSTLDNIQPFIVTLSEHAKKNSYQEILKIIKDEFEGLEVRVGEEMIPCKLFMLKGDNLAVNSILKLSASFSPLSSTNQCRFCHCTYEQFQEYISSSLIPRRMIRVSSTNELLPLPLNRSLDPFHDLHEGVVPQITFLLIRRGVQQRVFSTRAFYDTAVEISKQLKNHTKFHDSLNSAENMTWHINNTDVTKKTTLRLNGSQSVTLLYALPIIFDMLCPNGFNMEKELTSKLIDIVRYCTSNTMQNNEVVVLDSSITDFLKLLKNMEPSFAISIKFHNLCHYKLMIETYGLPKSWSCEREESTNAVLKQLVLISKNRVNVPKTCFRKLMQRKRLLEMLMESDPSFDPSNKPVVAQQVTRIIGSNGKIYEIK